MEPIGEITRVKDILYCNKCDQESPCILMNSEGVPMPCPNMAEWRPLDISDGTLLRSLRRALNDIVSETTEVDE